ncbi:hypothetical protein ES703_103617 [subsurface metagenome]
MRNMIVLWWGELVAIPAGWVLCDGNNSTPDLRDVFVIGAGGTYALDDTGGSVDHSHGFTGDGHQHTIPFTNACPGAAANLCLDGTDTGSQAAAGTTNADGVLPPYRALYWIMKSP